jgi:hypothetical protein
MIWLVLLPGIGSSPGTFLIVFESAALGEAKPLQEECPTARHHAAIFIFLHPSRMLKNSSTGAHHLEVCTGDLGRAGRFGKAA